MTIPDHLITPLDWSAEALRHAKWAGQPARARALIESKRYLAMHELIERLRRERDDLASGMQALRAHGNITSGELITGDDLASGMQALRARLAEIERAEDLAADIIEAQRAVVQQLASRPACDWPGKCAHKRPAQAAAPERAASTERPLHPFNVPLGERPLRRVHCRLSPELLDELDHFEDERGMVCRCGPDGCSDSVACPKGER